jgi:choline dehydrogenase-like flavoprotein
MPQDTSHTGINNKAVPQHTYDAIVVGSGITGGWAAKELCEKGLKTLLLERGKKVEHIKDYITTSKEPWEFPHRGSLTPQEKQNYPIQTRHYSIREDNKHFYILDKENPYNEIQRYDWVRGDILGGRSVLWGRMCYRWSDFDFNANLKDGAGTDWPIRYRDIAPWYDYAERFVGISGNRDGLPELPDGQFQSPMEMNCVEQYAKKQIEEKFPGRKLTIGRVANLTQQLPGRGACQYRNLCHRGCPFGAYFSTQSSTLPAAQKTGNLSVQCGMLVNKVIYDVKKEKAIGVEVLDRDSLKTYEYYAKVIFLNAATLGTTFLLLNSTSSRFPNGMGNDNDIVGRHLMDHHKSGGISATIEGFEDKYYFGRRPTGIYVPRFRNMDEKSKQKDYLRGFGYQGGAGRRGGNRNAEIGEALKEAMTEPGSWNIGFSAYGECLPYAENRVTLNTDIKDKWGRPTLNIDCSFKDNEKKMREDAIDTAKEMLEAIGGKDIRAEGSMSFPGNANHEMGTAKMGNDPKTSVLNKWNQVHAVKNVFVTDGSCMVSSSCVNPSLTYMALTARACDYAVNEMKKGNL